MYCHNIALKANFIRIGSGHFSLTPYQLVIKSKKKFFFLNLQNAVRLGFKILATKMFSFGNDHFQIYPISDVCKFMVIHFNMQEFVWLAIALKALDPWLLYCLCIWRWWQLTPLGLAYGITPKYLRRFLRK